MKMRLRCLLRNILIGLIALIALAALAAWLVMRMSLATLDGEMKLAGLASPVSVHRDARGTATIQAATVQDAIRALGFIHAQERFFEMDLARRSAAGELSEILGAVTLPMDREKRRHRLRARMTAQWQASPQDDRDAITAYTAGVNAGLNALDARPWQYLVLNVKPEPWQEVDSLLVVSEMYFMLQASGAEARFADIRLRARVGDRIFDWLKPGGGHWDAPLDTAALPAQAPLPTAAELSTGQPVRAAAMQEASLPGSNNWAVGGALTGDGVAILADDMHLGLGVPNIWFRTQFQIGSGDTARRIAGITLPGLPGIPAGSNGKVAWGFTNSYGQWFDWVKVADDPSTLATYNETIRVKGGAGESLTVLETPFGPVLKEGPDGRFALSWTLYRDGAVNLVANRMMFAKNMDEAVSIAQQSGIPHQNVLIADSDGNIAWTIMGRMPDDAGGKREMGRGRLATAAALPTAWLAPEKYPLVKNPPDSRLWTANSRQLAGAGSAAIGDGGFDLGARTTQIRDRLREKTRFEEKDLYAIQLDEESRFLKRWAALAATVAKPGAVADALKNWNGHAAVDQVGHRVARAFRERVMNELWLAWISAADQAPAGSEPADKRYAGFAFDGRLEYPVWQALSARPANLLPKPHADWDAFLAAQLQWVQEELTRQAGSVEAATWGKRNTARIQHPFSRAMPFLSSVLDMPPDPLAGDNHMPRVATPRFGASQRMVVAPGREERGILTMPGGQSGHPLSKFYAAGHEDWVAGRPTPLLAGETLYTLRLAK